MAVGDAAEETPSRSCDVHDAATTTGLPCSEEPPESPSFVATRVSTATRRSERSSALANFVWVSALFSANHGCVVSCLSLATARLGNALGSAQSGILYGCYTASALLGATSITRFLGPRNAMVAGMSAYVLYVLCFWVAAVSPHPAASSASSSPGDSAGRAIALLTIVGGAVGGWGAGFLWTAQGSYFVLAAKHHAALSASDGTGAASDEGTAASTSELAGIFAFVYLAEEVLLRILSTLLLGNGWSWSTVFASYAAIALLSTVAMVLVRNYRDDSNGRDDNNGRGPGYSALTASDEEDRDSTPSTAASARDAASTSSSSPSPSPSPSSSSSLPCGAKMSSTLDLLWHDPKMKYMVGPSVVFGWTAAFLNSYVNGQVVPASAGQNGDASLVGLYTAWVSVVAALGSLALGRSCVSSRVSKIAVLMMGCLCFAGVAVPFLVAPGASKWRWPQLGLVYTLHGLGRATFEGTLKAVFADYFGRTDKEGAFANIVLQNGLASSVGYVMSFALTCADPGPYCILYRDGTLHDMLTFELLIAIAAILAVMGLSRAAQLRWAELVAENAGGASQARPLVNERPP